MIERKNLRLNFIFTFWFVVVTAVSLAVVLFVAYNLEKRHAMAQVGKQLAVAARFNDRSAKILLERQEGFLSDVISQMPGSISAEPSARQFQSLVDSVREDRAYEGERASSTVLFLSQGGQLVYPKDTAWPFDIGWLAQGPPNDQDWHQSGNYLVRSEPVSSPAGWIMIAVEVNDIGRLLQSGINDARNFTPGLSSGQSGDLGSTADAFLVSADGKLLSNSLMLNLPVGSKLAAPTLGAWLKRPSGVLSTVGNIGNSQVVMRAEELAGVRPATVMVYTITAGEVISRLQEARPEYVLTYIFALISILIVLYVLVGAISRAVIQPIYVAIADLLGSSTKLTGTVSQTEKIMERQMSVSASLSQNYRQQVKDVQAMEQEIGANLNALSDISKQTRIASQSVQLIDQLAAQGQNDAKEAQERIGSIRTLSSSNAALSASLANYSRQVTDVALEVERLSSAIRYLSLNASIETSKDESGGDSLSSMVSEVGSLSILGAEASQRINALVKAMQTQLSQTKQTSMHETAEAEQGFKTIDRALRSLRRMSSDTMKISASVKIINQHVTEQLENTEGISRHAQAVSREARDTSRDALKIKTVIADQSTNVKATVSALRKLNGIAHRLGQLIGAHDEKSIDSKK